MKDVPARAFADSTRVDPHLQGHSIGTELMRQSMGLTP
jgi:hypothetical protein